MPIIKLKDKILYQKVEALRTNFTSGWMKLMVTGTSIGFGGTEPAIYVPTFFWVNAAVANLAKEYDLRDATQIYNFGNDIYSGEIRVNLVNPEDKVHPVTGFYIDYRQIDPNESWELAFNWYARE
jgi:hypothetical protein